MQILRVLDGIRKRKIGKERVKPPREEMEGCWRVGSGIKMILVIDDSRSHQILEFLEGSGM